MISLCYYWQEKNKEEKKGCCPKIECICPNIDTSKILMGVGGGGGEEVAGPLPMPSPPPPPPPASYAYGPNITIILLC